MFATRGNNENAIYEQQTAAAAKPLNQGIKGLAPKTPANKPPKTPFKGQKNDENANGFTLGKGGAKEGKAERNVFVTPANPRTRAPLGNKTTNAKNLHQTPAAPQNQEKPSSTKPSSPRLRRSKIKVHEPEAEAADNILQQPDEEREIEYMPPRGEPLPDYPDDIWPHDREYPQLQGKNLVNGWLSEYMSPPAEDAFSFDFRAKCKKAEEQWQKDAERKKVAQQITTTAAPATLKAHTAASALGSSKPKVPSFAAPTAAAQARKPVATAAKKPSSAAPGNPRFTAAKVASNSTIGYSKGRKVSSSTRQPLTSLHAPPPARSKTAAESKKETSLAELLGLSHLYPADEDVPELFSDDPPIQMYNEDEEVFQLPTLDEEL